MNSQTQLPVLFPASYPKCSQRLQASQEKFAQDWPQLSLDFPQNIRARVLNDELDYLAGTDKERARVIEDFLLSEHNSAAWFGRGGFGLTRILNLLPRDETLGEGKCWMGYSDLTALFAFCRSQNLKVKCIHGPMLCAYAEQPNPEEIIAALQGRPSPIPFTSVDPPDHFEGVLWGGNLAVLASIAGTNWLPTPEEGEWVFLEDVDEAPYRLDRYLTQLKDSGFFRYTKNVVLGTFTGKMDPEVCRDWVVQRCRELGLNVVGFVPAGHSEPHVPIFLGHPYRLVSGLLQPLGDQ